MSIATSVRPELVEGLSSSSNHTAARQGFDKLSLNGGFVAEFFA